MFNGWYAHKTSERRLHMPVPTLAAGAMYALVIPTRSPFFKQSHTRKIWRCRKQERGSGRMVGNRQPVPYRIVEASPASSPEGSMHVCHWSSSAWASQNHLPHFAQCAVAGKSHGSLLGDTAWHKRSKSLLSASFTSIDAPHVAFCAFTICSISTYHRSFSRKIN